MFPGLAACNVCVAIVILYLPVKRAENGKLREKMIWKEGSLIINDI
jgi:hypothetical protein